MNGFLVIYLQVSLLNHKLFRNSVDCKRMMIDVYSCELWNRILYKWQTIPWSKIIYKSLKQLSRSNLSSRRKCFADYFLF